MSALVWLALASVAAVVALFVALAVFLVLILGHLRPTGGHGTSLLAKVRLGLRAIEIETGHLPVEVTRLNGGLTAIRDGLGAVDANLARLAGALAQQGKR